MKRLPRLSSSSKENFSIDSMLEVGLVGKPHGLKGEVSIRLTTNCIEERTAPGAVLFTPQKRLVIAAARPHKQRWVIKFSGIDNRSLVESIFGQTLYAEPLEKDDTLFVHDLIGKDLIDQKGQNFGLVVSLLENPASDLLELSDGQLVPMNFYVGHDDKSISVSVPSGLLEHSVPKTESDE